MAPEYVQARLARKPGQFKCMSILLKSKPAAFPAFGEASTFCAHSVSFRNRNWRRLPSMIPEACVRSLVTSKNRSTLNSCFN